MDVCVYEKKGTRGLCFVNMSDCLEHVHNIYISRYNHLNWHTLASTFLLLVSRFNLYFDGTISCFPAVLERFLGLIQWIRVCNERFDIDNFCAQQLNGAWVSMETHVVSMRIRVVCARVCVCAVKMFICR